MIHNFTPEEIKKFDNLYGNMSYFVEKFLEGKPSNSINYINEFYSYVLDILRFYKINEISRIGKTDPDREELIDQICESSDFLYKSFMCMYVNPYFSLIYKNKSMSKEIAIDIIERIRLEYQFDSPYMRACYAYIK